MDKELYTQYVQILNEELVPAMGCTEPIAIAYAAARARDILGKMPERVHVRASGNLIKNAKSVIVPNTGGLKGIEAAAAAGIAAGDADKILQVISVVTEEQKEEIREFIRNKEIKVSVLDEGQIFDLIVELYTEEDTVSLRISEYHTNIVYARKNDTVLLDAQSGEAGGSSRYALTDRSKMSVATILEFAETAALEDFAPLVKKQIDYNYAIAEEGISGRWGANIGGVLLDNYTRDARTFAKAMAAAGSDARMSGCELPVIITAGSGNQGIAASVPVAAYAKFIGTDEERMIRAVALSDLITIHLKTGIGRLSAYCGAVSAGCAAGAAIAWMTGGSYDDVAHTLVNALAIISGIICDGAKPSCAAKVATSVEAGLFGYEMYKNGQQFYGGDGIVSKGVENTIRNIGRLGNIGMRETDKEIIRIMTGAADKGTDGIIC